MRRQYEQWFEAELTNKYKLFGGSRFGSLDAFMEHHGFFCTVTFFRKQIETARLRHGVTPGEYDVEHDSFLAVYKYVAEGLHGRKWQRPGYKDRLPFVISCLDFAGSKYASASTLGRHNAHIHAAWMVHPLDISRFKEIIASPRFKITFRNGIPADRIRFDAFDPSKGGVSEMASYAAKSQIKSTSIALSSELLRFYPNLKHGRRDAYKRRHEYLSQNLGLERLRAKVRKDVKTVGKEMEPWEKPAFDEPSFEEVI